MERDFQQDFHIHRRLVNEAASQRDHFEELKLHDVEI